MSLTTLCNCTFIALLMQATVLVATDWWWGKRDPFGPYPRIADKDLVKREIEFAEECRKFIKAPKDRFIHA